jgi:hypothetical protein
MQEGIQCIFSSSQQWRRTKLWEKTSKFFNLKFPIIYINYNLNKNVYWETLKFSNFDIVCCDSAKLNPILVIY